MYHRRGGDMRGVVLQKRPAVPSHSPAPSSSSSSSQQSSPSLSSRPPPLHANHPSNSVPPSPVEQSNDEDSLASEDCGRVIRLQGDSFEDATSVVRELNKIVNNYWRGPWISYSSAPEEVKELWWNEFKWKFSWNESDESEITRIFKKKAGDHIRNVMNRAKTKNNKPYYISSEDWTEIKRTWEGEKMKQMSERNAKNRASSSSEGPSVSATYAGGFINIGEHRKRLAHELGTLSTYATTFERVFQKKDKTWVGDRAKSVMEKYEELLMSAAGGDDGGAASEPAPNNTAMWVEASGGVKRGKIYGWGNLSREMVAKDSRSSLSITAASRRRRVDEEMAQQVGQLTRLLAEKDEQMKLQEERMSLQMSQKDDQIRSLQAQMAMVLQTLNINPAQVPPMPQANQIGGQNDERRNDDDIDAEDLLRDLIP